MSDIKIPLVSEKDKCCYCGRKHGEPHKID